MVHESSSEGAVLTSLCSHAVDFTIGTVNITASDRFCEDVSTSHSMSYRDCNTTMPDEFTPSYDDDHVHVADKAAGKPLSTSHVTAATENCTEDEDHSGVEISSVNMETSILNITEDDDYDGLASDSEHEQDPHLSDDPSDSYLDVAEVQLSIATDKHEEDDFAAVGSCDAAVLPHQEVCALVELEPQEHVELTCTAVTERSDVDTQTAPVVSTKRTLTILDHMDRFFERICISNCHEDDDVYPASLCSPEKVLFSALGCRTLSGGSMSRDLNHVDLHREKENRAKECNRRVHATKSQQRSHTEQLLADRGRRAQSMPLRRVKSVDQCAAKLGSSRRCHSRRRSHLRRGLAVHDLWDPCLGWSSSHFAKSLLLLEPSESPISDETGYESDPCLTYNTKAAPSKRARSPHSVVRYRDGCDVHNDSTRVYATVQEALNTTWELIWMDQNQPVQVQVWFERGALLQHNSTMVEPRLVWRRTQRSSETLFASPPSGIVRLLHVSKVIPLGASHGARANTNKDRLCRAGTSWVVETVTGGRFTFSAATSDQRDCIVYQWKWTVARLATLAVLEDASTILDEFFASPSSLIDKHNRYSEAM